MKRLMTLVMAVLLSLGVASMSLAQEGTAGQAGGAESAPKATKKHSKKHKKSGKGKQEKTPAAGGEMK